MSISFGSKAMAKDKIFKGMSAVKVNLKNKGQIFWNQQKELATSNAHVKSESPISFG